MLATAFSFIKLYTYEANPYHNSLISKQFDDGTIAAYRKVNSLENL